GAEDRARAFRPGRRPDDAALRRDGARPAFGEASRRAAWRAARDRQPERRGHDRRDHPPRGPRRPRITRPPLGLAQPPERDRALILDGGAIDADGAEHPIIETGELSSVASGAAPGEDEPSPSCRRRMRPPATEAEAQRGERSWIGPAAGKARRGRAYVAE